MAEQSPLESLQQKLDNNALNPREYNQEQLTTIDNLLEQGVLKGPRMNEIIQNFNAMEETIAKEKQFAKDPLGVALQDRSILEGEVTGLIPTRPGAELVGDLTGSLIPYFRNKEALVNSLKLPKAAQSSLFAQKAANLSRYLEKIPRIGKAFRFTRGILMGAAKAADAATSARLKPLIATEAQSLLYGAAGAATGVAGYDLVNRSIGKDLAVAINSDLANMPDQEVQQDTGAAALQAFKNSLLWGGAATATLPLLGGMGKGIKALFGLKGQKALELSQFANQKGLPIPLLSAMNGGPLSNLGKSYFKTVGVFPFVSKIGDQALRDAEVKFGKAFLKDLAGVAPITKMSALSVASLDQFKKQFEKYSNIISAGYTDFMRKVDDVGNPAFINLKNAKARSQEFLANFEQSIPGLKGMSDYGTEGTAFVNYRNFVMEELSDKQDPLVQLMGYLKYAKDMPITAKEFSGIQKLATKAMQQTRFKDARASIFALKEGLEDDFAESAATVTKDSLLKDELIKAEYDKYLAEGGQGAADRFLADRFDSVSKLNNDLKLANAQFNMFLRPYEQGAVANAIKAADRSLFTAKQLYNIGGRESISPTQLFEQIEKVAFKSGDADAIEQLKILYGYNTSKAGKQMFDRAFSRHIYNSYLKSFSEESLKTGSAFDLLNSMQKAKPKTSSLVDDVIDSGAMRDFYDGRNIKVNDVLRGTEDEAIEIAFGKGDFAEFNADKFRSALGLDGPGARSAREALIRSYGGGTKGAKALDDLEKFLQYTKALSDVPISETSSFLQRRLTLGGGASLLGGVVMGGGMFAANPLAPLVFLYASRKIGKILTDPTALRYMMDVLTPEERLAKAVKEAGVKKVSGVPVTFGESRARAFARFANYMAEEDQNLPKVDPKNVNDAEIIERLTNLPIGPIPKRGYQYKDMPSEEKKRIFPEKELEDKIPTSLLVDASAFEDGYELGQDQAVEAVNVDYNIAPSQETEQQDQGLQSLQAPKIQTLEAPQMKAQKYASLFPFDITGQMLVNRGGTNSGMQ